MISHCANPLCCRVFMYFNQGRVFVWEGRREGRSVQCSYWLCDHCMTTHSLQPGVNGDPLLVKLSSVPAAPRGGRSAAA